MEPYSLLACCWRPHHSLYASKAQSHPHLASWHPAYTSLDAIWSRSFNAKNPYHIRLSNYTRLTAWNFQGINYARLLVQPQEKCTAEHKANDLPSRWDERFPERASARYLGLLIHLMPQWLQVRQIEAFTFKDQRNYTEARTFCRVARQR